MDIPNNQPVNKPDIHYEAVATGKVKKINPAKKFVNNLIKGDINVVKDHVYNNIFMPMVAKTIMDTVNNALAMLFKVPGGVNTYNPTTNSAFNYTNPTGSIFRPYYNYSQPQQAQQTPNAGPQSVEVDAVEIFADEATGRSADMMCEIIKSQMEDILLKFKKVRLSEFYELCGMSSNFTDARYGWFNLTGMHYERTLNGTCILYMPRCTMLPSDIQ